MKTFGKFFAALLVAALLAGCAGSHNGSATGSGFELRMYKVPVAESRAIAKNLDGILASPEFLVGSKVHTQMRATTPFPGTVLVLAPASVQPSIGSAVDAMAKAAGPQAEHAPTNVPLRVQFWAVQALAGAGPDAAGLQPLAGALGSLRSSLGPSHFVLEDTAALQVNAGDHPDHKPDVGSLATARGHVFQFRAMAPARGDVVLTLNCGLAHGSTARDAADRSIPELNTTVAVAPGSYVVLAEALPPAAPAANPGTALMNLLVVRVDRVAMPTH